MQETWIFTTVYTFMIIDYLLVLTQIILASLVNGYNLPLRITNDAGCPVADCPVDLGPNCKFLRAVKDIIDSFTRPSAFKGPF